MPLHLLVDEGRVRLRSWAHRGAPGLPSKAFKEVWWVGRRGEESSGWKVDGLISDVFKAEDVVVIDKCRDNDGGGEVLRM